MRIRLGYVAIALNLKEASTSKTITVTAFNKIENEQTRIYKIRKILSENLKNTIRILSYNDAYNIKVYRITSKLVPLATHELIEGWDYISEFKKEFKQIGDIVKEHNIRVSAHPDHYTVINTNSEKVFKDSLKDLEYHNKLFEAMELDNRYKLVLHVGGLYNDKAASIKRFKEGFKKLSESIATRIILENDDKIYNTFDVLDICRELDIPMVLDVHHHNCNNDGRKLETVLGDVFNTWRKQYFIPKIHFSSPKNDKEFRSHADYINPEEFLSFLDTAKNFNTDFDVMLEAKNKDLALFKLIEDIKNDKNVEILSESEFIYK